MAELEELLDFPPAPKLGIDGMLNPRRAAPAETRGQALFFGKGQMRDVPCGALLYR